MENINWSNAWDLDSFQPFGYAVTHIIGKDSCVMILKIKIKHYKWLNWHTTPPKKAIKHILNI